MHPHAARFKQGHIPLAGPLHLYGNDCNGVGPPPTIHAPDGQLVVEIHGLIEAGIRATAEQAVIIEHSDCHCSARIVPADTEPEPIDLSPCPGDAGCIQHRPSTPEPMPDDGPSASGCSSGSSSLLSFGALLLLIPWLVRARRR